MIHKAAEHITEVLSIAGVVAEIGDKRFWKLAEEGTTPPFANFDVSAGPILTKDTDRRQYDVDIMVVAATLTEASIKAQNINAAIRNSQYRWTDAGAPDNGYLNKEATSAFVTLKFTFKL